MDDDDGIEESVPQNQKDLKSNQHVKRHNRMKGENTLFSLTAAKEKASSRRQRSQGGS